MRVATLRLLACWIVLAGLSPAAVAQWAPEQTYDDGGGVQPWLERLPPVELEILPLPPPEPAPAPDGEAEKESDKPTFKIVNNKIQPINPDVPTKAWDGKVSFGFNGSSGNTENVATRVGLNAMRRTAFMTTTIDLLYVQSRAFGEETANEAILDMRNEWPFKNSPLTVFIRGLAEYDEFTAWSTRVQASAGLGYEWIKSDTTTLITRLGGGFSREIGGPMDEVVPESSAGVELDHKISDVQRLKISAEIFHDLTDFNDFRMLNKAGWETVIDPAHNISLELRVTQRYDSTPHGQKRNDLDYAALVQWKF